MVHFHVLFMRVFTVGQSRRISEANNRELEAQYCQIQQVSGNPRRGRLTVRIISSRSEARSAEPRGL